MFSTKARLIQRTGKNGVGRYDFLKLLATEYKTTKSKGKKEICDNTIYVKYINMLHNTNAYSHFLINIVMLISFYLVLFSIIRREGASIVKFGKLCL